MQPQTISIIIPTLNEVENLRNTISHTLAMADNSDNLEFVVVDAGSTDGTLSSIENMDIRAVVKPDLALRKFASLNCGFSEARGEVILFLDADTKLPRHFDLHIRQKLTNKKVVGGAFEFSFESPDWKLALLTLINRIRYRLDKHYYGDQAIFCRKAVLETIGGVPKQPLMEAAYLCKALKREGSLTLVRPGIRTSARRFEEQGFFRVAWFDFNMFIRFNLGLSVARYAEQYWHQNLKA